MSYFNRLEEIGTSQGRPVTETLYVWENGSGTNGKTWDTAYTTINDALDAASTDPEDCTLVYLAPSTTQYDINTTGDPSWSCNCEIRGTHRSWAVIKNSSGFNLTLKLPPHATTRPFR